jgi:hypothetical protein
MRSLEESNALSLRDGSWLMVQRTLVCFVEVIR